MKKINLKSKVTKFYEDHKAACLIVAGIIGGAVGIAVEKKMECDRIQEMQEMYEVESHIYDASTDMTMFHNDHGKNTGSRRYISGTLRNTVCCHHTGSCISLGRT